MKKNLLLIFASLALTAISAQAAMYRYVDENGQVVYTQFRPAPGVEAETIQAPPPPPSTAGESQKELLDNLQKQAENREDRKEAAEKKADESGKETADKERMKKNCEAAKNNLKVLQNRGNRKLLDKDGNALDLSDEKQLQKRIQRAREVINRDCK